MDLWQNIKNIKIKKRRNKWNNICRRFNKNTPKIQEIVKEYFNGKEILKTVNPDEIIAPDTALFLI